MSINVNELTIAQVKEIAAMFPNQAPSLSLASATIESIADTSSAPVEIGKSYLFRTVTHIEVGKVKSVHGNFITLEQASWIADTGRYHDCLAKGVFNEVEPYPETTTINAASLINYAPWSHALPTEQK